MKGNGEFSGEIIADTGSIGSWNIGSIGTGWGSGDPYPNSLYSITKSTDKSTEYLTFFRIPSSDDGEVLSFRQRPVGGTKDQVTTNFAIAKDGSIYIKKGYIGNPSARLIISN